MRIAGFEITSCVDGTGIRNVVFFQGCNHGCPGCHNPQTHPLQGGVKMEPYEVFERLTDGFKPEEVGITYSGGDPFVQNGDELKLLTMTLTAHKFHVWAYTGYTFEELLELRQHEETVKLLDVVVDGRFELKKRTLGLPFRGSTNQRLVDVQASIKAGHVVEYNLRE